MAECFMNLSISKKNRYITALCYFSQHYTVLQYIALQYTMLLCTIPAFMSWDHNCVLLHLINFHYFSLYFIIFYSFSLCFNFYIENFPIQTWHSDQWSSIPSRENLLTGLSRGQSLHIENDRKSITFGEYLRYWF